MIIDNGAKYLKDIQLEICQDVPGHIINDVILRSLGGVRSLNITPICPVDPAGIDQIPA